MKKWKKNNWLLPTLTLSIQRHVPTDAILGYTEITKKNAYFEVFAKKKYICPNRSNNGNGNNKSVTQTTTTFANKPNYYNKFTKQPKQKMSNSLELLQGPISEIQKK